MNDKIRNEVDRLLAGQKPFRVRRGFVIPGTLVAVEIIPWYPDDSDDTWCDLRVTLTPYGLPANIHPEIVAGAHEALAARQQSNDPRIRAATARALAQLNAPRVEEGDLEGIELELQIDGRPVQTASTDASGQLFFRHLDVKARCRLNVTAAVGRGIGVAANVGSTTGTPSVFVLTAQYDLAAAGAAQYDLAAAAEREGPPQRTYLAFARDFPEGQLTGEVFVNQEGQLAAGCQFKLLAGARPPSRVLLRLLDSERRQGVIPIPLEKESGDVLRGYVVVGEELRPGQSYQLVPEIE